MIRCVRLWTADDGNSHYEEGTIDLSRLERGDLLSDVLGGISLSFQETESGAHKLTREAQNLTGVFAALLPPAASGALANATASTEELSRPAYR
jgi:hypothetical protein